jgi:protease-4
MSELDSVTPDPGAAASENTAASGIGSEASATVESPTVASSALPPETPPRRKSRAGVFLLGALSGCLVLLLGGALIAILIATMGEGTASELSLANDKVAIVPIEGEIFEARDTVELLNKYAENASIKAIVVRINSPGGAIAPSQEIYAAIRAARSRHDKPIVASMDSVAASGGYYIAAACDDIVANPGTITGSIGVIMQWFDLKDLVQWAKMKPETITSGPLKAAGSPYREISEAERQYFQRIVNQLHLQFVHAIAEGRKGKISEAEVAHLADGRVFTGEEALSLKLVDKLGSIDEAVRVAGKLAGIKGEPTKVWPRKREQTLIDMLTSESKAVAPLDRILSRRAPQFLYRW